MGQSFEFEELDVDVEEDELLAPDGFGMGATRDDEGSDDLATMDHDSNASAEQSDSDDESVAAPVPHPD